MSKIFDINEMLIVADQSGMPGADRYIALARALAEDIGQDLAQYLGVRGPVAIDYLADRNGGGVMGGFSALKEGQPMPQALAAFDPDGDWGVIPTDESGATSAPTPRG